MTPEEFDARASALMTTLHDADPEAPPADRMWVLESVYTHPDHRRRGHVRQLLTAVIQHGLATTDCNTFKISVAVGNDAAETAYAKLGFEVAAVGDSAACMSMIHVPGFKRMTMTRAKTQAVHGGASVGDVPK